MLKMLKQNWEAIKQLVKSKQKNKGLVSSAQTSTLLLQKNVKLHNLYLSKHLHLQPCLMLITVILCFENNGTEYMHFLFVCVKTEET